MSRKIDKQVLTSTHWGAYNLAIHDGKIVGATPFDQDPDPSPIGNSIPGAVHHKTRVSQPMIRQGWLERGDKTHNGVRGQDAYVPVSWDVALDAVAGELSRVSRDHGNEAIFGGSYGWSSAGRFHHAQSHVHRFLNSHGGYVRSVNTYSSAAARVILPHILGDHMELSGKGPSWADVADAGGIVVMFGGLPMRNSQIDQGGIGRHVLGDWLKRCRANDVDFVNVSPLAEDAADYLDADWLAPRPNTDTALMLGLAYVIFTEGLYAKDFVRSHCTGFPIFQKYLTGETDGIAKDPTWAAEISGIAADDIVALARRMASERTLITLSLSLQRADHGEQPYWMAVTLAAMLGQFGLPGGGIGVAYGAFGSNGVPVHRHGGLALPQGDNAVAASIPVARIVEMLENPGGAYEFNGEQLTYPEIRLIYWAGGNPFHHHQDLNRMARAWQKPETIIFHEPWWTPAARHADIVLPATTPYERSDIGRCGGDPFIFAMTKAIEPQGQARDDYDIFSDLAIRLGIGESYTEGRDAASWQRHMYDIFRQGMAAKQVEIPTYEDFLDAGLIELAIEERVTHLADFHDDPVAHPLPTPSGKVEIFSETIDSFGYDDCPGHATWLAPAEWLGGSGTDRFPLHMISPQPKTRLHSQLDCGEYSLAGKVAGREPVAIHPDDAAVRDIVDGDIVRLFNDRGECLAGARVTSGVRPGVVALPTGAWYDPTSPGGLERHGNPNVLTRDIGTSRLAQGPTAHTALVQLEKLTTPAPAMQAHEPPAIVN